MANDTDDVTDTPVETLAKATEQIALPSTGMALLGTMISDDNPVALLRVRPGAIRRVKRGDKVGQSRVVAIEPGAIHLLRNGTNRKLSLPES